MATSLTCPQCGSPLEVFAIQTKLMTCRHCHSSLLVEKKQVRNVNIESQRHERLSLIHEKHTFRWKKHAYIPQGFVQFKHRQGYRTDWWVLDENQQSFWLSEDDENFFLLQDIAVPAIEIPAWERLQPNTEFKALDKTWLVTERQVIDYQGIHGNLPEIISHKHLRTTYLVAEHAETLVFQFHKEGVACRQGYWLDPFELEVSQ